MNHTKYLFSKNTGILLAAMLMLTGCLEKGSDITSPVDAKLVVVPFATEVKVGDTVHFDILLLGEIVEAGLYVDGVKVSGNAYTFSDAGSFTIVAKKEGYLDSDPHTITVTDDNSGTPSYSVYVVGYEENGNFSKATLWKNDGDDSIILGAGVATAIVRFGGVSHISGYVEDDDNHADAAKYWENGTESILFTGAAKANSVYVEPVDGMVFIGGNIGSEAAYWKDGVQQNISSGTGMRINDLAFDDWGFYAVGDEIENGKSQATIWASGDRWGLEYNGTSHAYAIVVKDRNYYISGAMYDYDNNIDGAVYWSRMDGLQVLATPDGLGSAAYDICVKGTNIYLAGVFNSRTERKYAAVWINGNMIKLTNDNERGSANAITVADDGTLFIAGWSDPGSYGNKIAMYWQVDASGNILKTVKLTDGDTEAEANGIALGN